MSLDHLAIMKAYPQVTTVDDTGLIIDSDGKNVVVEQSKIDAARVELDKLNYQSDRTLNGSTVYASFGEQLGMLYDDMVAGKLDTTGTWGNPHQSR